MGRLTIVLPDDIEKKLRVRVAEKCGGKKGALGEAIAEALKIWLEKD
jgi:hypothetical protein